MIIHNVIQGTPEWHNVRLGKMTASHAQCIAANGKGLDTYCRELAAELFTGQREDSFTSEAMQLGIDDEDIVRQCYEMETGNTVDIVGFIEYSPYLAGCSPDGLVGTDGGVEIKRQNAKRHNDILLGAADFDAKYIWQCHMNMLITDRQWWDLMSYNPTFKHKSLFVKRILRGAVNDAMLLAGFNTGEKLIQQNILKYK